jgi:hypothetical protein
MTRICLCREAGAEMVPFEGETHRVDYRGQSVDVDGLSASGARLRRTRIRRRKTEPAHWRSDVTVRKDKTNDGNELRTG